jgi:hypothetical protein
MHKSTTVKLVKSLGIDGASQTDDRVQFLLFLRYRFKYNLVGLLLFGGGGGGARLLKSAAALWRALRTRMVYSGHDAGVQGKS